MQKRVQKPELEAGDGRGAQRHGKRQQQSEHTKALFLKAAEEIFIRDGFEAAKLEEIASKAGYTRGAFYANFESKEDLFLDVAEIHIQRLVESLKRTAKSWQSHSPVRRLDALREHFMNSAKERNWTIIGLELKLFSLRHPELKPKIAALRARAFAAAVTVINEQLQLSDVKLPVSTAAFAVSLAGVTHGLHLDRIVDGAISEEEIKKVGRIFFDCMVEGQSGRGKQKM